MKADFILKLLLVTIKNLHWRCNLISHAIQCWGIYIIWIFRRSIFWNLLSNVGPRLASLIITDITLWMFDQPLFILRVQHHRSFYHPSLCFFYKQHSFHCENQPLWRIVSYECHITTRLYHKMRLLSWRDISLHSCYKTLRMCQYHLDFGTCGFLLSFCKCCRSHSGATCTLHRAVPKCNLLSEIPL